MLIISRLMSDHLGYYISDLGRLIRKRFDNAVRPTGITGPQWRVLITVKRNPGINQGQIAERLEVEPITTCRMVDRLEQAGLLERRRDPTDRRAWNIYLTDAAKPMLEELQGIAQPILEQATAGLTGQEIATLAGLIERLRTNLQDDRGFQGPTEKTATEKTANVKGLQNG